MTGPRVLVTGSRTWDDRETIRQELLRVWLILGHVSNTVLVSGGAPSGADAIAEDLWRQENLPVEVHPARWELHGRVAGFIRNREMVDLGADVCLAFLDACIKQSCASRPPHPSHGADHCAKAAAGSRIEVVRIETPRLRKARQAARR